MHAMHFVIRKTPISKTGYPVTQMTRCMQMQPNSSSLAKGRHFINGIGVVDYRKRVDAHALNVLPLNAI